jgi:AraC-like DNA-binding protein
MSAADPPAFRPDPLARGPRADTAEPSPHHHLSLAPPALQGALLVLIRRDTRGLVLSDAQRLVHFPASPLLSLSWSIDVDAGSVETRDGMHRWHPFGARVVISGSQSQPRVCWTPGSGHGGMVCFTVDVARTLFGIDPAAVHDRFVPAHEAMHASWAPLLEALLTAPDADTALQQHVAPRWQALQGRSGSAPTLQQLGRHWVERLAKQAHDWRRVASSRQVERRIKSSSGRSLREWQSLVRTEGVFFTARARYEAGEPLDWAALAQEEGFADQSHLVRNVRRITGFTPTEFVERYLQDESFWLYRLWV